MQLAGERTHLFVQQPLDERVDVLVLCVGGLALLKPLANAREAAIERGGFGAREHADAQQRLHPRTAAFDVFAPDPAVDGEAAVQLVEARRRGALEAAAPQAMPRLPRHLRQRRCTCDRRHTATSASAGFGCAAGSCAWRTPASARVGIEKRRMKPFASAWS